MGAGNSGGPGLLPPVIGQAPAGDSPSAVLLDQFTVSRPARLPLSAQFCQGLEPAENTCNMLRSTCAT